MGRHAATPAVEVTRNSALLAFSICEATATMQAIQAMRASGMQDLLPAELKVQFFRDTLLRRWASEHDHPIYNDEDLDLLFDDIQEWFTEHWLHCDNLLTEAGLSLLTLEVQT